MTVKTGIVERLGEQAVLLPSLLGEALAANDRIKHRLSLLQDAGARARDPAARPPAGADPLVAGAAALDAATLYAPGIQSLLTEVGADLAAMLAPLPAAGDPQADSFAARVKAARASLPDGAEDRIALADIARLAAAGEGHRDSVHQLVMDLHKALNRLAADTAVETIDGAHVHGLDDRDRARVRAFMRGLNRTAPLAFGHPGLGTTAVRTGARLTIQNDIGTTDAHVLVVHVDAASVTVTYTDIHRPRSRFFIAMFEGQGVEFSRLAEKQSEGLSEAAFYLLTGRRDCADEAEVLRFLDFLASRIVFLIDWNKARKTLQLFVAKGPAVDLLLWAARQDVGHRAFLELGGESLVFEAVDRAAAGQMPYGMRLDAALGAEECADFLRGVLRETSQGLAAGRSTRLIRDQIQTDLARRFASAESAVLTVLVRHLGLSRTLASAIADLLGIQGALGHAAAAALAARAKRIERKADDLTVVARETATRVHDSGGLRTVIDEIECTADALEDCAFTISLVPDPAAAGLSAEPLVRLSEIVTDSVGSLVRAVEAASRLPGGQRADALAALQAIDAVVSAEHAADDAERDTFAALMAAPQPDARALVIALEIARSLEEATDHLSHAALSLRDRVLQELAA